MNPHESAKRLLDDLRLDADSDECIVARAFLAGVSTQPRPTLPEALAAWARRQGDRACGPRTLGPQVQRYEARSPVDGALIASLDARIEGRSTDHHDHALRIAEFFARHRNRTIEPVFETGHAAAGALPEVEIGRLLAAWHDVASTKATRSDSLTSSLPAMREARKRPA